MKKMCILVICSLLYVIGFSNSAVVAESLWIEAEEVMAFGKKHHVGSWDLMGSPISGQIVIGSNSANFVNMDFSFMDFSLITPGVIPDGKYQIWVRVSGNWFFVPCPVEVSYNGGKSWSKVTEIKINHRKYTWKSLGLFKLSHLGSGSFRLRFKDVKADGYPVIDCFLLTTDLNLDPSNPDIGIKKPEGTREIKVVSGEETMVPLSRRKSKGFKTFFLLTNSWRTYPDPSYDEMLGYSDYKREIRYFEKYRINPMIRIRYNTIDEKTFRQLEFIVADIKKRGLEVLIHLWPVRIDFANPDVSIEQVKKVAQLSKRYSNFRILIFGDEWMTRQFGGNDSLWIEYLTKLYNEVNRVAPKLQIGIFPANYFGGRRDKNNLPLRELIVDKKVPYAVMGDHYIAWRGNSPNRPFASAFYARYELNRTRGLTDVYIVLGAHINDIGGRPELFEIPWEAVACALEGISGLSYFYSDGYKACSWLYTNIAYNGHRRFEEALRIMAKLRFLINNNMIQLSDRQTYIREGAVIYGYTPNAILIQNRGDKEATVKLKATKGKDIYDVISQKVVAKEVGSILSYTIPAKTTAFLLQLKLDEVTLTKLRSMVPKEEEIYFIKPKGTLVKLYNFEKKLTLYSHQFAKLSLSKEKVSEGKQSLKGEFLPATAWGGAVPPYQQIVHFLAEDYRIVDWSDYTNLNIDVYNPEESVLKIGMMFNDSCAPENKDAIGYFRTYLLSPKSWNKIEISLKDISHGEKSDPWLTLRWFSREGLKIAEPSISAGVDLKDVIEFKFYLVPEEIKKLPKQKAILYFDNICLSR